MKFHNYRIKLTVKPHREEKCTRRPAVIPHKKQETTHTVSAEIPIETETTDPIRMSNSQ